MIKQLRIIIGDIGDEFASKIAASFAGEGIWAVTRLQRHDVLTHAVRMEHADVLILNLTAETVHVPVLTEEMLRHPDQSARVSSSALRNRDRLSAGHPQRVHDESDLSGCGADAPQHTCARGALIRHAIIQAWENADRKIGLEFGIRDGHRMTNSEFISFAVDWLRTEQNSRRYG